VFVLVPNLQSKTVFRTDASKGAKCECKSHLGSSEHIGTPVEVRDELAVFNPHNGFEIQALHDRHEI